MFCRFICAQALHSAGVLLILSLTPAQTLAGQGNLAWDYSTTGAAGFALYCGTGSGQYSQRINAGNRTGYTLTSLTRGATYFCAVVAYDNSMWKSPQSGEISFTVPGTSGAMPPPDSDLKRTPPPVARFAVVPTIGTAPRTVIFTNTTTGGVSGWSWAFGDGGFSTVQNPKHIYDAAGSYCVKLSGASFTVTHRLPRMADDIAVSTGACASAETASGVNISVRSTKSACATGLCPSLRSSRI